MNEDRQICVLEQLLNISNPLEYPLFKGEVYDVCNGINNNIDCLSNLVKKTSAAKLVFGLNFFVNVIVSAEITGSKNMDCALWLGK